MIPQNIRDRVTAEVTRCIAVANAHYGRAMKMPMISYNLSGSTAGRANYFGWQIKLNAALMLTQTEEQVTNTTPHEVAHLIDREVNGRQLTGQYSRRGVAKRDIHGDSWKRVMHLFGANPERCHDMDVTDIKRYKTVRRHIYRCGQCNHEGPLGDKHHAFVQHHSGSFVNGVFFKTCKYHGFLTKANFVRTEVISGQERRMKAKQRQQLKDGGLPVGKPFSYPEPLPLPDNRFPNKVPNVTPPKPGSKIDHVMQIVGTHGRTSRKELIRIIAHDTGMTTAGAQTYYYLARKKLGLT